MNSRVVRPWAWAWLTIVAVAMSPGHALAAPGTPGVPQPPSVVFTENFENNVGATPVRLMSYVGATGETYTADPVWLTSCNGVIVEGSSPRSDWPLSGCGSVSGFDALLQLSYAQGVFEGATPPTSVHTVAALTDFPNPGANKVQFRTVAPIPLVSSNRFLTFAIDVDAFCTGNNPRLGFFLLNGTTRIQLFTAPIDPCTDPRGVPISVPAIGTRPAATLRAGTYVANGSALFTGSSVGIEMTNGQGAASGNDSAFTDIRILDATPQLDKSFAPTVVDAGQPSTLTLTITNTTDLAAKNGWSFTDTLPAGLTIADPANAATSCPGGTVNAPAGGGAIAVTGNLSAGQASCTITVNVTAAAAGTYANCPANVSTVGLDAPACAQVTFDAADVRIAKSASPSPAVPGTDETFELVVSNDGPSAARNVAVSDPLPPGLTFVSASPGCGEANGTVTCTIGSLGPGASQSFQVIGRVASSVDQCLGNTATVTSATPDPQTANNTSTVCVPIQGRADLSITKTPSRSVLPVGGGQVMYTLVVGVSDPMAPGLTLVSAEPSQGSCSTTDGRLSCALGGLAAGGSAQVLVTAQTWGTPGAITNTATVSSAQQDTDPGDNAGSATVTVPPGAPTPPVLAPPPPPPAPAPPPAPSRFDLAVSKRASDTRAAVGQPVTYTIEVTNRGPAAAPDVNVTDTLNAPVTVVAVKATAGSCTKRIPVRCALGTIAAGGRVTITIVAKHKKPGCRQRNAAGATGAGAEDANPADNLATVDVCAKAVPLRLTKVADRAWVRAGGTVGYTIGVSNPSSGEAKDVQVCDKLPSGLVYLSSKAPAKFTAGQYCWTIQTLGAHRSQSFRITVRALGSASGDRVNRATVSAKGAKTRHARDPIRVLAARATGGGVTG
jgi:uncharacterized repeat protein (TIGR01451 family)